MLMPRHSEVELLAEALEGMAEHTVPDVVQESRSQGNSTLMLIWKRNVAAYGSKKLSRNMKHADAVSETRMGSAGEYELGKAKLFYTAKSLERSLFYDFPKRKF